MAATPIRALGDVYGTVTPALPELWVGVQPEGTARTFPNGDLVQTKRVSATQGAASVNGGTGIRYETVWAKFSLWYESWDGADAALTTLLNKLTPKAATVTGATTVMEIEGSGVPDEPQKRGPQGQYVFMAWAAVKMQVDYMV